MTVRNAMARLRSREGFTLIELLIVMVVLGILFTIGLFLFNDVRQSAENTAVKAEVRAAYTQVKSHHVDNGTFVSAPDGDINLTAVSPAVVGPSATVVDLDGATVAVTDDICTSGGVGADLLPGTADDLTAVNHSSLATADGEVSYCGTADTVFVGKMDASDTPELKSIIDNGTSVTQNL